MEAQTPTARELLRRPSVIVSLVCIALAAGALGWQVAGGPEWLWLVTVFGGITPAFLGGNVRLQRPADATGEPAPPQA